METGKTKNGKVEDTTGSVNALKTYPWSNRDFGDWEPAFGFELMPWLELRKLQPDQYAEVIYTELYQLCRDLTSLDQKRISLRQAFLHRHSDSLRETEPNILAHFLA